MIKRLDRIIDRNGQSTTETLVLLPFYFLLVFGLIQAVYLGGALMVVDYAASSLARKAVQEDEQAGSVNSDPAFSSALKGFMMAGMNPVGTGVWGCQDREASGGTLTQAITVYTVASVPAFPLISQFLNKALGNAYSNPQSNQCPPTSASIGPFFFSGKQFLIRGSATAQMNYQP